LLWTLTLFLSVLVAFRYRSTYGLFLNITGFVRNIFLPERDSPVKFSKFIYIVQIIRRTTPGLKKTCLELLSKFWQVYVELFDFKIKINQVFPFVPLKAGRPRWSFSYFLLATSMTSQTQKQYLHCKRYRGVLTPPSKRFEEFYKICKANINPML
jgi:hypothetical protein